MYEGFQYEPLTQLRENLAASDSLSKGFSGGWNDIAEGIVHPDGLTYGSLLTHGGSLWHEGNKEAQRPLDVNALPALAGVSEIWMSFLLRRDSYTTPEHNADFAVLQMAYPRVGATLGYRLNIGKRQSVDGELFFQHGTVPPGLVAAEPVDDQSAQLGLGETKLIVFKLSLNVDGTNDFGQMFVNPALGQSAPDGAPIAESQMNLLKWFQTVGFSSSLQGFDGPSSEFIFDEFRMGSTYADVTPTIPEPSSLLLLGTAGAALIGSRRRRKAA
ncbi:MAG: PEP-CTERM sorting domain-containing protein [Chthoniobacteraceae bacterium]